MAISRLRQLFGLGARFTKYPKQCSYVDYIPTNTSGSLPQWSETGDEKQRGT